MKNLLTILCVGLISLFVSSISIADHHAAPRTSALEGFFCSFNEGKDMGDLMKVAAEWDSWADEGFSDAYQAYVLSPVVSNRGDFPLDTVWLGVAENQEAMGAINDSWMANGGKLQKKFDAVSTCSSHSFMDSFEVVPYKNIGGPGFVQIQGCEMKDGASMTDLMAADKSWSKWMAEQGMPGGIYRWFTGVGDARESTTDFYNVFITESMASRGRAHDMMMAGGFPVRSDAYDNLIQCDKPRVWVAQPVGGKKAS